MKTKYDISKDFKMLTKFRGPSNTFYYYLAKGVLSLVPKGMRSSKDLSFMPASYIETAQFDCLRDEAILLGEALQKSGVKVVAHDTQKTIHGYDLFSKSEITKESLAKRYHFLNQHLNG